MGQQAMILFEFSQYWTFYAAFTGLVILLLLLDLGIFHRDAHAVSFKEASAWTAVWITLALIFNYLLYLYCKWKFVSLPPDVWQSTGDAGALAAARRISLEFLTGYIVEKSLSIDNIFVFLVVFSYFQIPAKYQHRILFLGIIGALLFRSIFIALGSILMQYHTVIIIFGAFLIFTGIKLAFTPEKPLEPEKNPLLKIVRKIFPVTHEYHGQRFFVRIDRRLFATPLFMVLVLIEFTDVVFALDSVPAIFALTREPFIVFTSNIFAILGLRSLYFMLASVVDKFHLLKYALAMILVFVGLKMVWLNDAYDGKFPISWSLGLICGLLASSIILSFIFPAKAKEEL